MDSNAKSFLVKQKCKEFLAFTSLEVRFLVDSSSCSKNKSYKRHGDDGTIFLRPDPPSNSSHSKTWHTHKYVNSSDDSHWASARAVRVVQLFSMADSRTERLHVLLPASNSRRCIALTYLVQPSLISAGFPMK